MSGGTPSSENAEKLAMLDTDDVERLLDEEMKDDTSATPTTPSTCGSDSNASSRAGSRRGSASSSSETAWNFVQMNMTLLPIARPLPVNVTHRLQDTLFGRKPRTPNQKLHHRVLRNASNISPRHHEYNMLRRRGSTSSENGTAASAHAIPRPMVAERQLSAPLSLCGKRKSDHDHYMTSTWQPPSAFYRPDVITSGNASDESRGRSLSEDLSPQDVVTSPMNRQLEGMVLSRSASTSAALTARGALFKDKRILEIQDEERRLVPNERAGLASPTKRSRRS